MLEAKNQPKVGETWIIKFKSSDTNVLEDYIILEITSLTVKLRLANDRWDSPKRYRLISVEFIEKLK